MENWNFEQSLVEEQKGLDYFALSLTNNKEEAHDLVQETFLKALLHKQSFNQNTNIKAWLFTIMKNTFINNYRRGKRERSLIESENLISVLNSESGVCPIGADHDLHYQNIKAAISTLPDEQRIPFEMINQGYKYQEIADKFMISIGTVKSRIFLARRKLMSSLGGSER